MERLKNTFKRAKSSDNYTKVNQKNEIQKDMLNKKIFTKFKKIRQASSEEKLDDSNEDLDAS